MSFNFDESIDRSHTDSEKWAKYAGRDILPMWVADSDFRCAPNIIQALEQRVAEGLFGYGKPPETFQKTTAAWLIKHYQWDVDPDWIIPLQGIKSSLALITEYFCTTQGSIITHTPTYPVFTQLAQVAKRQLVKLSMQRSAQGWRPQSPFALASSELKPQLLMLCNPHNPTGHVFLRQELEQISEFCLQHDLLVCSDEIHADLVLDKSTKHIPFATLNPDCAQRTITLVSPSKTFNLAGLGASAAVIPNPELRQSFKQISAYRLPEPTLLGLTAATAAWQGGADWLGAQRNYLLANRDRLVNALQCFPEFIITAPKAGFLAWIDCEKLGVADPSLWFELAGLGLTSGKDFGNPYAVRLNFACSRARLEQAIERISQYRLHYFR